MDAGEVDDQDDEDYEESMSGKTVERKVISTGLLWCRLLLQGTTCVSALLLHSERQPVSP